MTTVCADCGHEQTTMDPCEKCKSHRVILASVAEEQYGPDWRAKFKKKADDETIISDK